MPSQKRKDDDLVPKDVPERSAKRPKGQTPVIPPPNDMPAWEPLAIANDLERGKPNLPRNVNRSNPIELFKLFFTDEWLTIIAERTNANAEKIMNEEKNSDFRRPRSWHPVDMYNMMRYLAAVIHMGLHPEAEITDYWAAIEETGVQHRIPKYISLKRWQQIDRFLYCEELRDEMIRTFERVWALSKHIQKTSCKCWTLGKNLAVDESMQRFTGRAKEITNILCKKHSIGYKIWILADHGYSLLFIFHSKGDGKFDGPYRLDTQWKEKGFSATEAVVLHLTISLDPDLLKPNMHILWLDNLFTKIRLLEELRRANIGAAGTVRPPSNQTPREERLEIAKKKQEEKKEKARQKELAKEEREAKKKEKEARKEADKKEKEAKREKARKEKQNKKGKSSTQQFTIGPDPIPPPASIPFHEAASLFEELFESSFESEDFPNAPAVENETLIEEHSSMSFLHLNELPDAEPPGTDFSDAGSIEKEQEDETGNPETNEPFDDELIKLRALVNWIEWGSTWYALSENKTLAEIGW